MKLSAEEKLMYQVMKAIYESGIPVSFTNLVNGIWGLGKKPMCRLPQSSNITSL
jgi:hypothetical protein